MSATSGTRIALLACLLTGVPAGWALSADRGDVTARTTLPLKKPRSRDPVLGGARDRVFFSVWLPAGVRTVRGAVCNPFSRDEGVGSHWKAACRHWKFAYVQTDLDGVRKEEFGLLEKALAELAEKSGHPEVARMPLFFTGMSRGGGMSMQLAELMPRRTIACVPVCLEVGPASDATRQVPVLTIFGEKDGRQMKLLTDKLPKERDKGARWAIAVQWNRRHEFGQANNLSWVFLDDVIAGRLPKDAATTGPLAVIPLKDGWLGDVSGWGKDGRLPAVASWADFKGERDRACWLPSRRSALVWQAFVSGTRDVTLTAPAGLGDRQKFVPLPADRPVAVKLTLAEKLRPTRVELWDGDQRLAQKAGAPWAFEVKLKPGIHSLYAVAHQTGAAERLSRPHTVLVAP